MSMKALAAILLPVILTTAAGAGSAGTTGFELFRTDGWARNSALGESQIAVAGDLHSVFSNPAGLAEFERPHGAIGFFKHVLDINSGSLAYARPFREIGVLALGVTYFDYGSFDRANEYGQKEGEFGVSDVLVSVSGGRVMMKDLCGGVTLKYLYSNMDSHVASALAADAGVIYHTGYEGWDVGAGIYNAGFATSAYLTEKDDLPTAYRFGVSVPLKHLPARVSFAGEYTSVEGVRGCGGLELTFSRYLQARLGYNTVGIDQRVGLSSDALAGFSGGLGLHARSISFDYALTSQGEVGMLHRFTLGTVFPAPKGL
jgi:hypothetical protein